MRIYVVVCWGEPGKCYKEVDTAALLGTVLRPNISFFFLHFVLSFPKSPTGRPRFSPSRSVIDSLSIELIFRRFFLINVGLIRDPITIQELTIVQIEPMCMAMSMSIINSYAVFCIPFG